MPSAHAVQNLQASSLRLQWLQSGQLTPIIMTDGSQLPIALRRTRRSSLGPHRQLQQTQNDKTAKDSPTAHESSVSVTSGRIPRPRKKVRFSDPGPALAILEDELSTGLTPMIRRTSLATKGLRRHSTPAQLSRVTKDANIDNPISPCSEVHFLPLRQVLDGRVKRRIRRNGLSEEMNTIHAERKKRAQETKAEMERLRAELAEKDEEIRRMHDETVVMDTERVWDLEQKIETLKRELASRSGMPQDIPSSPSYEWTMAARDPFSDDFMQVDGDDGDDDAFGDATMADLACSTPTRKLRTSFPTPPTTSPAEAPLTPCSRFSATPLSHTGVQAVLPDPEKQQLEDELASLQLEICKLTTTLESYSSFTSRLADKLSPFSPLMPTEANSGQSSAPQPDIEGRLATVLQTLSDRTAALLDLNNSLSDLGFPGSDAAEIVTSLSGAFRAARLELEYLTPGEVTLPLTSAGAAVLDLILNRLRDLAKKNREADDAIDEYHSIELSLRQQLGARVDAMDTLGKEVNRMEGEGREKDARISELEVGLERLKGAVHRYTRDVSELEALVQCMERDLEASDANRQQDQAVHEKTTQQQAAELAEKTSALVALEAKLASAVEQTTSLQVQLVSMQTAHATALDDLRSSTKLETAQINKTHGQALALRDARVAELRGEIDRVNASLRAAHETVRQLRVENGRLTSHNVQLAGDNAELSGKREVDKRKAKEVIDSMKAELERVVRMSDVFLAGTPKKTRRTRDSGLGGDGDGVEDVSLLAMSPGMGSPSIDTGGLLSGELAKKGRGRKRRRYDSGLGFLDEEDVV
ncbi:hypothetical protein B0T25DRAFT_552483 [Lasiosphaeria hispida]|uniref:Uncharacterized protein n=1 Tax=Lasiosphaeria hispida TaxID=260671 RepID=A0AAJ0HBP4_9PEZI|nr:hypothetical protein B0T25DRAFT_552483 [Lasiosphaeria hispida]